MVIDHIGVVVPSIVEGIQQWREMFGYLQASDIIVNTRQKVTVVFLSKPGSVVVKLVEPAATDSPVAAFARKGGGLHHLGFRCSDLKAEMPRVRAAGARFIVPPQPGEAFNGSDIAFFLARNNLNIELIDTDWKPSINTSEQPPVSLVIPSSATP